MQDVASIAQRETKSEQLHYIRIVKNKWKRQHSKKYSYKQKQWQTEKWLIYKNNKEQYVKKTKFKEITLLAPGSLGGW